MTREEAIKLLERDMKNATDAYYAHLASGGAMDSDLEDYFDAMYSAMDALREQEERSKGCEYCKEYKSIVEEDGSFISFDATLSKGVFLEACTPDVVLEAKVLFCPVCGRRLEEV